MERRLRGYFRARQIPLYRLVQDFFRRSGRNCSYADPPPRRKITMPKILLVDDDVRLAEQISEFLSFEDYVVELAHDGADAVQLLSAFQFDLIILDWELPDTTGLALCKKFRASGSNAPILFLTGRDSIDNKADGLNEGADDYMTKPFHPKELSARLRACLRRPPVSHFDRYVAGDLSLDQRQRRLTKAGREIHLRPKEYALLEYLMRHPNQYFSSKQLIENIWDADSETSEETIRTSIKTLRKKISENADDCLIKTAVGFGYILKVGNNSN